MFHCEFWFGKQISSCTLDNKYTYKKMILIKFLNLKTSHLRHYRVKQPLSIALSKA